MLFLKDLPTEAMLERYHQLFPELMQPETVSEALCLLRRASLLMRQLEQYFASQDLSQTRFFILIILDRDPDQGGLLACDLVDKMDVSKTVISKTITTLEKQGFITQSPHPTDKRAKWLRITALGQAKLHQLLPGYYQIINDFMKSKA